MKGSFDPDAAWGGALFAWWSGLDNNRGDRAELRRCNSPLEVMMTPAFHYARRKFLERRPEDGRDAGNRLPLVVGLAAHVTSPAQRNAHVALPSLPDAFSRGDRPKVSPLRFRQILEARDDDELFTRVRRVLPMVSSEVSVFSLANDLFWWNDRTRKRWVYDYRWPADNAA